VLLVSCSRKVGEVLRLRPSRTAKFSSPDPDKAARLFLPSASVRSRALAWAMLKLQSARAASLFIIPVSFKLKLDGARPKMSSKTVDF
jgi:hypothetical protein